MGLVMRLFVLVVLAAGALYPVARQPLLRAVAFCAMMVLYAGAGVAYWNEHDCRYARPQGSSWNLAVLARSPHDVSCSTNVAVSSAVSPLLLAVSYE